MVARLTVNNLPNLATRALIGSAGVRGSLSIKISLVQSVKDWKSPVGLGQ